MCVGAQLNGEQRNEVMEVVRRYEEISGKTSVIEHKIDLTDDRPIRCMPYPLSYAKRGEILDEIKNMMDTGIVRKSSSCKSNTPLVVKKKDGSNRMCVDYRKLNLVTVADPAPITTAEDLFEKLGKGMRKLLQDMDNVECYTDDLIVYTRGRKPSRHSGPHCTHDIFSGPPFRAANSVDF